MRTAWTTEQKAAWRNLCERARAYTTAHEAFHNAKEAGREPSDVRLTLAEASLLAAVEAFGLRNLEKVP